MPRYRIVTRPNSKPQTPWRSSRDAAIDDAVGKRLASRDKHVEGRVWWHALARIEEEPDPKGPSGE